MMKHLTATLVIVLLLLGAASKAIMAQGNDVWVNVSPPGEAFTVRMPQSPEKKTQKNSYGDLNVDARVYTAAEGGASYAVWSLKNTDYSKTGSLDTEEYLDNCADLVWESLLKPLRDKLPDRPYGIAFMAYQNELKGGALPGREYSIKLGKTAGVTNFYVAGERIYVLMVLNGMRDAPETERFLKSFTLPSTSLPGPGLPTGDARSNSTAAPSGVGMGGWEGTGIGPGRGQRNVDTGRNTGGGGTQPSPIDDSDPNKIYNGREVTQKARILSRPEPQYTESARKYQVTGTIVIRAVFYKNGEVTNIKAVKGLPHGLTQNAIAVTRQIKFTPAIKDGRQVSQFIQIEYNFNLY
jgi:TonB family protein